MTPHDIIRAALVQSDVVWKPYLLGMGPEGEKQGALKDSDLLVRPCPGANHIAWQLGHLISSEHMLMGMISPDPLPPLPEGFAEQHTGDKAASDDPAGFLTIADYLRLAEEQRAVTLATLEKFSAEDLQKEGPERMRMIAPDVASLFLMVGSHWLMHGGQWAVVRRMQGYPPLF